MQKIAEKTAMAQATIPATWKETLESLDGERAAHHVREAIKQYLVDKKKLPKPAMRKSY